MVQINQNQRFLVDLDRFLGIFRGYKTPKINDFGRFTPPKNAQNRPKMADFVHFYKICPISAWGGKKGPKSVKNDHFGPFLPPKPPKHPWTPPFWSGFSISYWKSPLKLGVPGPPPRVFWQKSAKNGRFWCSTMGKTPQKGPFWGGPGGVFDPPKRPKTSFLTILDRFWTFFTSPYDNPIDRAFFNSFSYHPP